MNNKLKIGLIGFGCVGEGLYEVLERSQLLNAEIKRIVVKDKNKDRSLPKEQFEYDIDAVINDPEINVVVELIDDAEVALQIAKRSFANGKHVVSANKKLIAEHLEDLIESARDEGVSFLYEAAVAGSIPIIRNLEEYYNNDSLTSVKGILNGTSNYILSRTNEGESYEKALRDAQAKGFAESDPTLDVYGFDAKYKTTLLIKHAFGLTVRPEELVNIGVTNINSGTTAYGQTQGWNIKLVGRIEKLGDQLISFVAPHFVAPGSPLYNVRDEFNAVTVKGLFADEQQFYGKGAGAYPTASAVLSDISALLYDYQYEYKKEQQNAVSGLTNQFYLKVFLGSEEIENLDQVQLIRNDEVFISDKFSYRIGWIEFSELQKLHWKQSELTVVVLPDELILQEEESFINVEQEKLVEL